MLSRRGLTGDAITISIWPSFTSAATSQKLRILRKVFFGDLDFDAVESVVDDVGSMTAC